MVRKRIPLEGIAYKQGDVVEVYLKLKDGKFAKLTGNAAEAKRTWGRDTRPDIGEKVEW